jgi:hypothetical protein
MARFGVFMESQAEMKDHRCVAFVVRGLGGWRDAAFELIGFGF